MIKKQCILHDLKRRKPVAKEVENKMAARTQFASHHHINKDNKLCSQYYLVYLQTVCSSVVAVPNTEFPENVWTLTSFDPQPLHAHRDLERQKKKPAIVYSTKHNNWLVVDQFEINYFFKWNNSSIIAYYYRCFQMLSCISWALAPQRLQRKS